MQSSSLLSKIWRSLLEKDVTEWFTVYNSHCRVQVIGINEYGDGMMSQIVEARTKGNHRYIPGFLSVKRKRAGILGIS